MALTARASAQGGSAAEVTVDFLPDGRCAVAARGEGFRSNATYRPQASRDAAGRRCAMPPVPGGRTVHLVVSLPPGADRPGSSVPSLHWMQAGDLWRGTASLDEWPETVVVAESSGLWPLWMSGMGLGALLAVVAIRRRRARHRTSSGA
jgi:MYXO-CTERM domain-containing protein